MKIFVSYSHRDKRYVDQMLTHLKPLSRGSGAVDLWSDTRLKMGDDWREVIRSSIENCDVAILMVSAQFLASDFIINNELKPLYDRHKATGIHILCVPISYCAIDSDDMLSTFQSLPAPDKPIKSLSSPNRDLAFEAIRKRLAELANLKLSGGISTSIEPIKDNNPIKAFDFAKHNAELMKSFHKLFSSLKNDSEFENEDIDIVDFWKDRTEIQDDQCYLSGFTFRYCNIFGPAVVYLDNCKFLDVIFSDEQVSISTHLYTPYKKSNDQYIYGVLLFKDCLFENCTFDDVAFVAFDGDEAQSYLKLLKHTKK
jgi:hypothetical protein